MTRPAPTVTVPEPLWMMHVIGPDDIYPAPDHATAVAWCAYLNREIAPKTPEVLCVGVPAVWTGTAEDHAAELDEAVKGWTVPSAPVAPQAAGVGEDEWSELERLANAATQGPWSTCVRMGGDAIVDAPSRPVARIDYRPDQASRDAEAAYIAAANPATIKRMIAALRAPSREPEGGEVEGKALTPRQLEAVEEALLFRLAGDTSDSDIPTAVYDRALGKISGLSGKLIATREEAPAVPDDVRRLVEAARVVAFEDQGPDAIKALDVASEAFADRVPWENEPSEEAPAEAGARIVGTIAHVSNGRSELPELIASALRAQPPAREDAQPVGWLDAAQKKAAERAAMDAGDYCWRNARLAMVEGDKVIGYPAFSRADMAELGRLYTYPAPDALRVAVEALSEVSALRSNGHADEYESGFMQGTAQAADIADQALTALKDEQKGGAA